MLRRILTAGLIAAVFATPASARIDEKRYANLDNVSCEDKQTIADIEEIWHSMAPRFSGTGYAGHIVVLKSKTINKSDNQLRCLVSLKHPREYGTKARSNGFFTLNIAPNGTWSVTYKTR